MPRAARYPERLMPPKRTRDAWRTRGRELGDKDYAARWLRFWKATLDACRDQATWEDRDVGILAEFVDWSRLAADHQAEAESSPYQTHEESGRKFAHPGFVLARDARREARVLAAELLLTPESRRLAGYDEEAPDAPKGDQAGL
jgi:phage terminase small subunit